jgi:AGCS family alanine or glycine:cation symporter
LDFIISIIKAGSNLIWATPSSVPFMVVLLLATGIFITFRLGWPQIRHFVHALGVTSGRYDNPEDAGDITHFQALSAALSATVGIGNIAGVATAIHYGGPGALFWMWITGILGTSLKYTECTLSMKYRNINPDGSASGGPMYYIEKGLGIKPLAIFFAIAAVLCSFGTGNGIQAFTVADQLNSDFSIPVWGTGLFLAILVAMVIIGGIKRIGKVAAVLAPGMAIIYVTGALIILLANVEKLPATFVLIFKSAFTPVSFIGGFAGVFFIKTMIWGVKRGLFSNEAGQGSAAIAHAAAKTKYPVREGTVAMLGPYIDTLLICSLTGLVIITTGVFNRKMTETRSFDHFNFDMMTVPAQHDDHWMNYTVAKYNKSDESRSFTIPEFEGEVDVTGGRITAANPDHTPVYPVELSKDTSFTLGLIRNHGFVDDVRFLADGAPFTGKLRINGSGSPGGQGVEMVGGPQGALSVEGGIYQNGSPLTAWGFQEGLAFTGVDWGKYIITIAVFLFALSTMISWSYYGDRAMQYLLGNKAVMPYRYFYCVVLFIGAISRLEDIWGFGDIGLGLMAIPNLIAILLLSNVTARITKEYFSHKHEPYSKKMRLF